LSIEEHGWLFLDQFLSDFESTAHRFFRLEPAAEVEEELITEAAIG
jgi:hypothetical protein